MDIEREMYERYTIHELRQYARKIGVKAATSQNKSNLIKHIKEIKNGAAEPYYTTKGRPAAKRDIEYNSISENGGLINSVLVLHDVADDTYSMGSYKEKTQGYARIYNESYGAIMDFDAIFDFDSVIITKEAIEKYDLRDGDYVECEYSYLPTLKLKIASEFTLVAGQEPNFFRPKFSNLGKLPDYSYFNLNGSMFIRSINDVAPIAHGTSIGIAFSDVHEMDLFSLDISDGCGDISFFSAFLDSTDEMRGSVIQLLGKKAICTSGVSPSENIDAIKCTLSRCYRKVELGNKTAMLFDLEKYVRSFVDDYKLGMLSAGEVLKKSGCFVGGGSITIFATMSRGFADRHGEYFAPLLDTMVYSGCCADVCDVNLSWTKNADKFLSADELKCKKDAASKYPHK